MNTNTNRAAVWSLAFAALLAAPVTVLAQEVKVVISQVYGGGGNSGATLRSDFIELRNNGTAPVSLDGWSVQYTSSAGTGTWIKTALTGSIAPGGYYLIKQADGSGGTVNLPTPDATGTIAMAGTSGKVILSNANVALAGACPTGASVVDTVGYGTAATCSETAPTANLTNTTAALRNANGATDTNNNAADFATGAPNPRNSGTTPPPNEEPPIALTIGQVQGTALRSTYLDKRVVVEGIVTARKFNNGFFLQSEAGDGDAATSDAIFVFTQAAPSADAAVGTRLRVTGKVGEFTPASNLNQLSITQITAPTLEVIATGAALPAAVELTSADIGPTATVTTLERLEGMRVSVAQSVSISGADGFVNEPNATSGTDGVFYVRLPDVAIPVREPGIGVLDAIAIPAGKTPPRFDTNPERLMVRSRAQIGATPIAVDSETQVSGLIGPLDYFDGSWALLPDVATPPTVSGGKLPTAMPDAAPEAVTVSGFNLLRFFDEINDSNGAPTITAAALDKRLTKTAASICDYVKTPDILGVVEVENLRVLGLLADRINATCASAPNYVPYLSEGNDPGGIDVGFLVKTAANGAGQARVEVLDVTQLGKDTLLTNPDGSTALLNDRPPLMLRARVHQDTGVSYPVTVIANHLRSLIGVDSSAPGSSGWPTEGSRVRGKRGAQAAYLASLIEQLQQATPDEKIVLVGDFNAFEFNDGYVDVMGVIKGTEAAEDQVLTYVDSAITRPLIDGAALIADPNERYSYVFEGNRQTLDHALVNQAVIDGAVSVQVDHARINADFGVDNFGDFTVPVRVSDHDPVRVSIAVPAFRAADLGVTAAASTSGARAGTTVTFNATVRNAGPNIATATGVAFVFDALLSPAVTTAPAGWSCATPTQDATTTTVTCTVPSLASGAQVAFALDAIVPNRIAPLTFAVAAQSQTRDPANGNNQAIASVDVLTSADLSVRIQGSSLPVRGGAIATFLVPVRNAGPDVAQAPTLVIDSPVSASFAAIAGPTGWTCARIAGPTFRAECVRSTAMPITTQTFAFAVVVPRGTAPGTPVAFTATVSSPTSDPSTANNTASYSAATR